MTIARAATLQETLRITKVPPNGLGWHKEIKTGLPYRSLLSVAKTLKLSEKDFIQLLGMTPRTAAARKKAKRLGGAESDLIYAVARAYVRLSSFKPIEDARSWLLAPVEALKGSVPVELLQTRLGTEYVMSTIDRERSAVIKTSLDHQLEQASEESISADEE